MGDCLLAHLRDAQDVAYRDFVASLVDELDDMVSELLLHDL